jgi:hypothetical protein
MTHVFKQITQDNMKRFQRVIINSSLRKWLPKQTYKRTWPLQKTATLTHVLPIQSNWRSHL